MRTASTLLSLALAAAGTQAHAADHPGPDAVQREQLEGQIQKAQERLEQAAHEVADLSMKLNDHPWLEFQGLPKGLPRSSLGLNVGLAAPDDGGEGGVQVLSVSPGSPADVAGLKARDVILSFDGHALLPQAGVPAQRQFVTLAHQAKADLPVPLEYRRDGKVRKTQITPKRFFNFVFPGTPEVSGLPALAELNRAFGRRDWSGLGSADLLELSPGLGRYFGTDKGLLVVHAPRDAKLPLQDGDVILDIDGRVPEGASHALRILSSYRAGEKLKLHIMRQQHPVELPIELPPDAGREDFSLLELDAPDVWGRFHSVD